MIVAMDFSKILRVSLSSSPTEHEGDTLHGAVEPKEGRPVGGAGARRERAALLISFPVLFGEKEKSRAVVEDRHYNQSLIWDFTLGEKNVIRAVMFVGPFWRGIFLKFLFIVMLIFFKLKLNKCSFVCIIQPTNDK